MARTAGELASWAALAGLTLAAMAPGCAPEVADPELPADLAAVLAQVGAGVVIPPLDRFVDDADALVEAAAAWSDAPDSADARAAAQAAWWSAMATWQVAEVMQIGPAGSTLYGVVGGEDLRDELYSWPTVNDCRVDQVTVEAGWDAADFFSANLVTSYGLDALERLLFVEGDDNACPLQASINTEGSWAALGAEGRQANRAAYAAAVAAGVHADAVELRSRWDDFDVLIADPLAADSPYTDGQQALNAIFDALFYVEATTKDRKVAQPLGLVECATDVCPDDAESVLSGGSTTWIAANLEGFRAMFTGGEGQGLDDLLDSRGHGDLATDILAALDVAEGVAATTGPIDLTVVSDVASVQSLHDAIKGLTDLLKGDLATVLSLEIPTEASGDND